MINEKNLPWQNYPERFIRYASKFERTKDEFERLIGYLLLDVGVESLLKAFILADTSLKYPEREASAKGVVAKDAISDSKISAVNFEKITFHNLLETVKLAAKSKVTDGELRSAEHYHGIRNIIYHEGRKTIPSEQDFRNYLSLGKSLLNKLLEIEKNQQGVYNKPKLMDELSYLWLHWEGNPRRTFDDLRRDIAVAIVLLHPEYASKRLEERLNRLGPEVDALSSIPYDSPTYKFAENELIRQFNNITGQNISNIDIITSACFDVTYLQLGILLSKIQEHVWGELEKYQQFKSFSTKPIPEYDDITQEYENSLDNFNEWVYGMQQKINSWFEETISKS